MNEINNSFSLFLIWCDENNFMRLKSDWSGLFDFKISGHRFKERFDIHSVLIKIKQNISIV